MKRLDYLKKLNVSNLRLAHLSKGCYLITNKNFELRASTFDDWKKYIFNFEESKIILFLIKKLKNTNYNVKFKKDWNSRTTEIALEIYEGKNKIVYECIKIKNKKFEIVLNWDGILSDQCRVFRYKEVRFL